MLKLISFFLLLTQLILAQGVTVNRKAYFDRLGSGGSPPADTGFYKLDAEDGLAGLTLTNGAYIKDTSGFSYAGSKCYKFRGNGSALNVYADVTSFPSGYGNEATIWVSMRVYIPSLTTTSETSNSYQYLTLLGSGGDVNGDNGEFGMSTDENANIDAWMKPFGTRLTTNFSTDTWHKIELKYVQGTGANAQDSCWIDGTAVYGVTNGGGIVDTDSFRFGYYNWVLFSGEAIYFDDIIFKRTRVN